MNALTSIFQDNSGGTSSIRVAMLVAVLFVFGKNLYLTIHTGADVPLDMGSVVSLASLFFSKAIQRSGEQPPSSPTP